MSRSGDQQSASFDDVLANPRPPIGSWGISEGGDATGGPGPGLVGAYAALAIGFGGGNAGAP